MSDDRSFQTFELPAEAFPFTINIMDKNGVLVDSIRVTEPGIMSVSGDYPEENGPYTCKIIYDDDDFNKLQNGMTLQRLVFSDPAYMAGWVK